MRIVKLRRLLVLGSLTFSVFAVRLLVPACNAQSISSSQVSVTLVTDEADAVLALLARKKANQALTDADWQQLFSSEGYIRLKKREASMQHSFGDDEFKSFVLSGKLSANAEALAETLKQWKQVSPSNAAQRALVYLPKDAHIRAKIYPVIKPRENSFVFEVGTDPAIFLYLNPAETKDQFENTLAHELHHIGYGSSCPGKQVADEIAKQPNNIQYLMNWIGAFGEGFAMLAAAGGPDIHPHTFSKAEDRARWDRDMANFNTDLKKVEQFFLNILDNKLNEDERRQAGFSFFGVQGPWYTVGWKMSVVIEKTYGRARLIECICDQRKLLPTYNQAAIEYNRTTRNPLAQWSSAIIEAMRGPAISNSPLGVLASPITPDNMYIMLDWSDCPEVERSDEKVSGAWLFRGTRVPVEALFEKLESGVTVNQFLEWFPGVTHEQVAAVLEHAEQSFAQV